jgi:hypothetical protein
MKVLFCFKNFLSLVRLFVMPLYLITFKGCPIVKKAKSLLAEAQLKYTEVQQDELPELHPYRAYSSPSLLKDDRLIFGSRTGSQSYGCTMAIPTLMELTQKLGREI